jgi:metallo-beta-lactamase family protein
MEIKVCGAAKEVTGSNIFLSQRNGKQESRVLLDCGLLYRGSILDAFRENHRAFPYDPTKIDALFLTHAHVDHCGRIPSLVRAGFRGQLLMTLATADLVPIMWTDTLKIQEDNARIYEKKMRNGNGHTVDERGRDDRLGKDGYGKGRRDRPNRKIFSNGGIKRKNRLLPECDIERFSTEDIERAVHMIHAKEYNTWIRVTHNMRAKFIDIAHVLGSAGILIEYRTKSGKDKRIFYTGDVGRGEASFLGEPNIPQEANIDHLIIESTYGDREHEVRKQQIKKMFEKMEHTLKQGGKIIVPAFALERTQEFMMFIYPFIERINQQLGITIPVYHDSPMGHEINKVFQQHLTKNAVDKLTNFDPSALDQYLRMFSYPGLNATLNTLTEEKKRQFLEKLHHEENKPAVIISSAGMCEHGPVLQHLRMGASNPDNLILLIGYMAKNTRGRHLFEMIHKGETDRVLRVRGEDIPVSAKIFAVDIFSSHADQKGLYRYARDIRFRDRDNAKIFLVHGNVDAMTSLRLKMIEKIQGIDPDHIIIPEQNEQIHLD